MSNQCDLEKQLDSFDPQERRQALEGLAALKLPPAKPTDNHNLHFHSFFSYNAQDWSPSHIAWAAHQAGLYAAGLCDFDVLDGLEEFYAASALLGLRATVNLETRVYLREHSEVEITSPGEPGVTYIMGAGFTHQPSTGSAQAAGLQAYRDGAGSRNVALIDRINPHLPSAAVDYAADVLPLTPSGSATERHIIKAYVNKARAAAGSDEAAIEFWAGILAKDLETVKAAYGKPALEEMVRSRLAKKGGLGYVQPSVDTFPPADEFAQWVLACDAVPMVTWLDGTSEGEKDGRAMLECLAAKGCAAVNIVPDRNWNYADAAVKATKVANLRAIVAAADDLGMPLNIGTEMNKAGLPFVDDLGGEVLSEFKSSFLRGARIMVGHCLMARYAALPYTQCTEPVAARNDFYAAVGALSPLTAPKAAQLTEMGPEKALATFKDSVAHGDWTLS